MPRFESENSWSLGQLFAGFMQHYDRNFDFTADVASVRTGRILPNAQCEAHARAVKNGVGQWKAYVCVEEPFERSNAARYVRSSSRPADAKLHAPNVPLSGLCAAEMPSTTSCTVWITRIGLEIRVGGNSSTAEDFKCRLNFFYMNLYVPKWSFPALSCKNHLCCDEYR